MIWREPRESSSAKRPRSSNVRKEKFEPSLDPDEYLILRVNDVKTWMESNPEKRLLVRKLELNSSEYVEGIGDCIVKLQELTHLRISWDKSLKWSDTMIMQMQELQEMEFVHCNFTELHVNSDQFKSLNCLSFNWCVELLELPVILGEMENLTHLTLFGCKRIKCLPDNMDALNKLQSLDISECDSLETLPANLKVVHLKITNCAKIKLLPKGLTMLEKLAVNDCVCCSEPEEWFKNLKDAKRLCHISLVGSPVKSLPIDLVLELRNLQEISLPEDFSLETFLPDRLADSVIISIKGKHEPKTWGELKSEINQSITSPHCQRELASNMEDELCKSVIVEETLENKDMLSRDMDTGISACCPIHPEPLIEVCSVTIEPNDENKSYKIYGEIFVHDAWGKKQIYKQEQKKCEPINYGDSLSLIDPDDGVVSMAAPVTMTINLKVMAHTDEKGGNDDVWFVQESKDLDTTTELCYEKTKCSTFKSNLGVVKVNYIVVPCGVVADVGVVITKEAGDQGYVSADAGTISGCFDAEIFGSITTCYGKTDECEIEYPSSVLYKKLEHECERVNYKDYSIELCRSLVCLPAYSSLSVKMNISLNLKGNGAMETIEISESKDFKCTESPPVEKHTEKYDTSYGKFRALVTVDWSSSLELQSHRQSQPSSSPSMCREMSSPLFGNSRIDVLSIFVGNKGHKEVDLCGTILVQHWDGLSYIFQRAENSRPNNNLSRTSKAVPLKGLLSYRTNQFDIHLRIKGIVKKKRKRFKNSTANSRVAINSCFVLNYYYYERISREWFDRPLCSVIVEDHGFAAVHYIVFKDAVKATVTITITEKNSSRVAAGSSLLVSGSLIAGYSKYRYSTKYEKNYCRSVLFDEEHNNGCWITEDGEIPLLRNVVSVPMDSSLIVEVDLRFGIDVQHWKTNVTLEIGDDGCKKILGENYDLVFTAKWEDG